VNQAPPYFADTAFWIALFRQDDQFHDRALAWQLHIKTAERRIVTTEAVLWEWMNALSNHTTRRIAASGFRAIRQDARIEVIPWDTLLAAPGILCWRPLGYFADGACRAVVRKQA
jgi:predicted nucleic acid-binding protein